jgi:copper resistance protein C
MRVPAALVFMLATVWSVGAENLEPAFSSVKVTDTTGSDVGQGKAEISGNTMRIELKPLDPGSFTVHWHAVSVDTHTTEGAFSFQVGGK